MAQRNSPLRTKTNFYQSATNFNVDPRKLESHHLRSSQSPVSSRGGGPNVDSESGYQSLCYVVRNFLTPLLPIEQSLESVKMELAKRKDFILTTAFQRFTSNMQAKLSE